jgi:ribosome biogenesis protein Nip4
MKLKAITNFAAQFGVEIALNKDFVVEKNGRFFLVNDNLKQFTIRDFYYAGVYLGKVKDGKFFPSFILLSMLARKDADRVVVDEKASWLFICGRDIFGKSILHTYGSNKKNTHILILNEFGECLGFGRIVGKMSGIASENEISVKNVSDIGDFLRRERKGRNF